VSEEKEPEKKVWLYKRSLDETLEDDLNALVEKGYHVYHLVRLVVPPTQWHIVAFHQVELSKKLASAQVLQLIQQAGADALKNAVEKKENKE